MGGGEHDSAGYGKPNLKVVRGNQDAGHQQCQAQRHGVDESRWRPRAVRAVCGEQADGRRQKDEHPVPVVFTQRSEHAKRHERSRYRQRQAVEQTGDGNADSCTVQCFAVPPDRY